ncbi:hypothetical protein PM082_002296 [Marasmius tenuissimus]|nr:hypothetical protein PM082_002296 [Marasmius tenuissimus]
MPASRARSGQILFQTAVIPYDIIPDDKTYCTSQLDAVPAFMYVFMKMSNISIFKSTTALFNENLFPKCSDKKPHGFTPVGKIPEIPLVLGENPNFSSDSNDDSSDDNLYPPNNLPKRLESPHDNDGDGPIPQASQVIYTSGWTRAVSAAKAFRQEMDGY